MLRIPPLLSGPLVATVFLATTLSAAIAQQPTPAPRANRAPMPSVQQPSTAVLPNGASAINETYGDWTVDCRLSERQKVCTLSQTQADRETGQRRYALELRPPADGKTEGTVLMPFGLNLDAGALLKLDDKDIGKGLRFATCLPQGCLLEISLPAVATDAMRKADKLIIASLNLSSGNAVTFNVSLKGFGAGLDRMIQLAR